MRPLGKQELAELLGVPPRTVYTWRHRGVLPVPDLELNGGEVWLVGTLHQWAVDTGRWPEGATLPGPSPDGVLPLDRDGVAEVFGVEPKTVAKWRERGQFPPADLQVNGRDAWWRSTVDARHAAKVAPGSD